VLLAQEAFLSLDPDHDHGPVLEENLPLVLEAHQFDGAGEGVRPQFLNEFGEVDE